MTEWPLTVAPVQATEVEFRIKVSGTPAMGERTAWEALNTCARKYGEREDDARGGLREENENWEGNYRVEYWNREWQEIVLDYLEEIVKSDFDGVFLDTVDTYYYYIYD